MVEVAALGVRAHGEGLDQVVGGLIKLAEAAVKADNATDSFTESTKRASGAAKDAKPPVEKLGDEADTTAGALDRMADSGDEVSGAFGKMASLLGGVYGKLIAMAAGALSVTAYYRYADAWSDMQSKVGAAVKDMAAAPALMERMVKVANASYSPLQQTVDVYSRNVSVLRELGFNANQAADFTESLNHMLVITATKGEQAASVQNALSRAMAVGKLNGQGLETVLANGGRVAEALAKRLGTTTNGLRGMAAQGKITGKVITEALLDSLVEVRKEAGEMPATVADGFQRISTGIQAIIGVFDQATKGSASFAGALVLIGDALASVAVWISENGKTIAMVFQVVIYAALVAATGAAVYFATVFMINVVLALQAGIGAAAIWQMQMGAGTLSTILFANATTLLAGAFTFLGKAILLTGLGALLIAAGYLIYKFMELVQATGGWSEALTLLGEVAAGVWEGISVSAGAIPPALSAVWQTVRANFFSMLEDISAKWSAFLGTLGAGYAEMWWIPGSGAMAGVLNNMAGDAFDNASEFNMMASTAEASAIRLKREAGKIATEGFDKAAASAKKLRDVVLEAEARTAAGGGGPGKPPVIPPGGGGGKGGGKTQLSDMEKEITKLNEQAAKGLDPLTKYSVALDHLNTLKANGLSDAAYGMEMERLNKELANGLPLINQLSQAWGDWVSGGFKDFKGFMKGILQIFQKTLSDMIAEAMKANIIKAIMGAGAGGGILGKIFSFGAKQANGGVWQGGSQVQAFAKGGVVNGPTMFPMSGGKTGLMGEAGSEAIMPLSRGPDGKLGVKSSGGEKDVNFNINIDGANGDKHVVDLVTQAVKQALTSYDRNVARPRAGMGHG